MKKKYDPFRSDFRLEDNIRDTILTFAETLTGTPQETAPILANYITALLPEEINTALTDIHSKGKTPFLVLHNLPIDRHIPEHTPGEKNNIEKRLQEKGLVSQRVITALSYLLGTVLIANPKEQNGKLIHNVAPDPEKLYTKSSLGVEPLDPHTESPQENNPPHYLLLLGLKGDPEAKTLFIPIMDILKHLSEEDISTLKKPIFELRSGPSYTNGVTQNIRSIIDEMEGRPILHYIKDNTRVIPQDAEAETALLALNKAIETAQKNDAIEITIAVGDAIIFNNGSLENGVMHARAGKIIDLNRWLQRGFLYEQADSYIEQNTPHLTKELNKVLNAESTTSLKITSTVLREVMLKTEGVGRYLNLYPHATREQALLYGTEKGNGQGSWIARIAHEAVIATLDKRLAHTSIPSSEVLSGIKKYDTIGHNHNISFPPQMQPLYPFQPGVKNSAIGFPILKGRRG